jgi:hypothetical protein
LPPTGRTPVIIRMMRRSAVINGGDLVSEKRGHMDRSIGKVFEGFDTNWVEERVGGEASVVSVVCADRSKVERRSMVEDRVIDTWTRDQGCGREMKKDNSHPPRPLFPPVRTRPYQVSGNHISNFTVEVGDVTTAPITRQISTVFSYAWVKHVGSAEALNVDPAVR